MGDEFVEIGVGEHLARALLALADADVAEIAHSNVGVKRPDRAAEFRCRLRRGLETVRQGFARFVLAAGGLRRTALPLGAVCLAVPT